MQLNRPSEIFVRNWHQYSISVFWWMMITLGWLAVATTVSKAQTVRGPGQLMVVFDGSGSMWGKLPGTDDHKFAFLRQELVQRMRSGLASVAIGLTTFGARSGGSCQSATTELPPSKNQTDAFEELMAKFNPQGRGPVALGLTTAASAIDLSRGPGRILLVHDSPDNCGQDVCELADTLAASGIVVDVVSLAQKPKDKGSMSCLAKATGGTLIEADQASDVIEGLNTIVASLALPQSVPIVGRAVDPKTAAPKKKMRPSSLRLVAKLKQSGQLIDTGVQWEISAHNSDYERTFDTPTVDVVLAPDRYKVRLRTATWSQEQTIDMKDGTPVAETFTYDGGLLSFAAASRTRPAGTTELVTITEVSSASGIPKPVWAGPVRGLKALPLPAGTYDISLGQGLSRQTKVTNIETGTHQTVSFSTALAKLSVKVQGLRPQQQGAARISILADAPNQPGRRISVAQTSALAATFELSPGPYEILLTAFGATSRQQVILGAGQSITETLTLKQLALKVSSFVGAAKSSPAKQVRYRIWKSDRLEKPFMTSHKAQPVFHLAPGKYRIESHIGRQNAIVVREFSVDSEGRGNLDLHHGAGEVEFALANEAALANQTAYWEVTDRAGRPIWRGFATRPKLTLSAGEYVAKLDLGSGRYQAKFAVVSGPRQVVSLDKL